MKRDYKKSFLVLIFILAFAINFVNALETDLNYSASSIVQIRSLKYEPYPVNPGEYFELWVSVQYNGNTGASGGVFELDPEFPFSLDSNESATKSFGSLSSPSMILKWKVRVDENAVEGTNELKLTYKVGGNWYTKVFDIEVANAQTTFDAIIQDSSSSEVSIAIANTGKNTANSVIVKIPEQDSFETTGTDGQMVGNLDSGDYSIVSFEISQKMNMPAGNPDDEKNISENNFQIGQTQDSNLTFEIYYTDNIGVRRTVTMELPLSLSSSNSSMTGMPGFGGREKSSFSIWYIAGIVLAILIAGFVLVKKFPKKTKEFLERIKKLFHRKNKENIPNKIPDWVKNVKDREKNK
jgi:hypothetical protein